MTDMGNEGDLRELFTRLRKEDRARTPSFSAMLAAVARRRRRRPRWPLRVAAAAAALVVITLAYEQRQAAVRRERARVELRHRVLAHPGWAAPTDFLLDTPGSRLLRTVPTFGSGGWVRTSSTNLRSRNPS
jgi:hypothetical protein